MPPGRRGKRAKKAPMESGESIIETLPDGVLRHILGFLPARDAARTCVLAQRWRDLWMFATGLRITDRDDDNMDELQEFVDHLLLLRGIAPLETCEIRLAAIADKFSDGNALRVNLWFQHAIRCQTRALRLVMGPANEHFDLHGMHLVSQYLMELELSDVAVKESFLNLSGCPALEKLLIAYCDLCRVKKVSSGSLKRLSISSCLFRQNFRTHIHTPSLVSLLLDDNFFNTPVLESMPSLVNASIKISSNTAGRCNNCDSGDCDSCHGIIHGNSNCILLEGLSKANNLALVAESNTLCKAFVFNLFINHS